MLNRVKVMVCGKEYMLQTEEAPSYVYGLAKMLDKKITDISAANSSISQYSASIMVALSILDDLNKAQVSVENVRAQAKEYVDEAGKARIERDAALKEIQVLKAKLEQYEASEKNKNTKDSI
ncbi:MAG: cell division protein ZapA [Porcipelethomonas sp.]